jgi:nicotinamide-nucleotide amidase
MTARTAGLAIALGRALGEHGWRVVTAESCTGGLVAAAITDIPGSSAWFDRGFVTYTNDAKRDDLGVAEALLEQYGAVSEPVALAMAAGALLRSAADVAVAITGIAGPGGGTPGKPVGTVCFAFARRDAAAQARTLHLSGNRAAVRAESVDVALEGLIALAAHE